MPKKSLAALRQEVLSQIMAVSEEELPAYREYLQAFITDLAPESLAERQLVLSLAITSYRLQKCSILENNLFAECAGIADPIQKSLEMAKVFSDNCRFIDCLGKQEEQLSRLLFQLQSRVNAMRFKHRTSASPDEPVEIACYDPLTDGLLN